jgi:hypothetical protein
MPLSAQEHRTITGLDTMTARERTQEEYIRRRILDKQLTEDRDDQDREWAEEQLAPEPMTRSQIETLLVPLETIVDFTLPAHLRMLRCERARMVRRWLSALRPGDGYRHVTALAQCGSVWKVWKSETEYSVHPNRCHLRDCPECQDLRRRLWYHRFKHAIDLWITPKHVTLTIRSSDAPLSDQLTRLMGCFRKLRNRKLWTQRPSWGLYVVEITRSKGTGQWHPHLHIIANMRFLPWQQLRAAWKKITGDSDCTWITHIDGDLASHLSRYVTKANDVWKEDVDLFHLAASLKGRRLVSKFGNWPIDCNTPKPKMVCLGSIRRLADKASFGDTEALSIMQWLLYHHAYALRDTLLPQAQVWTASDPSPPQRSLRLN